MYTNDVKGLAISFIVIVMHKIWLQVLDILVLVPFVVAVVGALVDVAARTAVVAPSVPVLVAAAVAANTSS